MFARVRSLKAVSPLLFTLSWSVNGQISYSESNNNINQTVQANSLEGNTLIVAGTAVPKLGRHVSELLGLEVTNIDVRRFSDGEMSCRYNESVREKNLYVIQSCAAPVNDNIMELLLLVSAARRAGAHRITAVIPYFGYKYHRRGLPISTVHQSRFLWSASHDFAEMLSAVGVDNIIAVDLQRPGQGHEACFFDNNTPIETFSSEDKMVEYFATQVKFDNRIVIVAPNADCVKKAVKFKLKLSKKTGITDIGHALFLSAKQNSSEADKPTAAEFQGNVKGADVIIVDEVVETGVTLSVLCRRLIKEGARRVYLCSSHGIFSSSSMELIDLSPVERVVVTDSIPLPEGASPKIHQISLADALANVIKTDARAHRQVIDLGDVEEDYSDDALSDDENKIDQSVEPSEFAK